jgi:hypothetical protein
MSISSHFYVEYQVNLQTTYLILWSYQVDAEDKV